MTAHATDSVLFEAFLTPVRANERPPVLLLAMLMGLPAAIAGWFFFWLGAWPVSGFVGLEVLLVVGLYRLHRGWTDRMAEEVVLTERQLRITHIDGRGAREEWVLEPYWIRLLLTKREGRVSELRLVQRGRSIEIGRFLGESEKQAFARALDLALKRYRQPLFDNPQLREPTSLQPLPDKA